MEFRSIDEMTQGLAPAVRIGERVELAAGARLEAAAIDRLVWTAVFADDPALRNLARWVVRQTASASGIWPATILDLYLARGRGEWTGLTVPAFNIRTLTYDTTRALFRAAKACATSAFIVELARSEI